MSRNSYRAKKRAARQQATVETPKPPKKVKKVPAKKTPVKPRSTATKKKTTKSE